ncbi:RsmB/NOP family class I SAM-dependent RNA methyltransferase [Paracoccus marinaquae]|uniref:RsmB/NOP family class I SAM-dependent RNA methyltransferase n=1 Tax=Paracoccus marinaquae TaxID=2841926 RepID=A0ABS6AR20_9RHOB|nr:RsmB/NOP family class I SAM-dependent RNA methyltransferase [Paracoccus marinaquae]MBU3032065.1 RsmB/NOP family class I SAM-dependent RNA methyltransferase [Paracoccus marinaquae]
MTPAARMAAAIGVLDRVLGGLPAEQALLRWSRASRFAGSGDRAAVRDLVYDALRRRNSLAARGGSLSGRGLMIGHLRDAGLDTGAVFTGQGHAPLPLTEDELGAGHDGEVPDLPDWLLPHWRDALGERADQVARAMGQRAPVWLRVNPLRGSVTDAIDLLAAEGIEIRQDARLATALCVTSGERRVAQSRPYRDGLVELQDLSPQLACAQLPLAAGDRVLDFCAGGGGKTLAVAGRQAGLRLFAHDADPGRMRDLPLRAERAGVDVEPMQHPQGHFDLVIADVPCSGSGTWRRSPDAKWRLTPEALAALIATQAGILGRTAGLVSPGGHLAYMTCSVLDEENDLQIDAFLARHAAFSRVARYLWTPIEAGDGFFLSLLRRAA